MYVFSGERNTIQFVTVTKTNKPKSFCHWGITQQPTSPFSTCIFFITCRKITTQRYGSLFMCVLTSTDLEWTPAPITHGVMENCADCVSQFHASFILFIEALSLAKFSQSRLCIFVCNFSHQFSFSFPLLQFNISKIKWNSDVGLLFLHPGYKTSKCSTIWFRIDFKCFFLTCGKMPHLQRGSLLCTGDLNDSVTLLLNFVSNLIFPLKSPII